jgi:hypothetical protein
VFCQRHLHAAILVAGGDYVPTVKDNQPRLVIDISGELAFEEHAQRLATAFSP